MSCGRGLNLVLLWLWCKTAATTPIGPLAWEPPYAMDVALKGQNKTKKTLKTPKTRTKTKKENNFKISLVSIIE